MTPIFRQAPDGICRGYGLDLGTLRAQCVNLNAVYLRPATGPLHTASGNALLHCTNHQQKSNNSIKNLILLNNEKCFIHTGSFYSKARDAAYGT